MRRAVPDGGLAASRAASGGRLARARDQRPSPVDAGTPRAPREQQTPWPWHRSRSTHAQPAPPRAAAARRARVGAAPRAGDSARGTAARAARPSSSGRCGSSRAAAPARTRSAAAASLKIALSCIIANAAPDAAVAARRRTGSTRSACWSSSRAARVAARDRSARDRGSTRACGSRPRARRRRACRRGTVQPL